MTAVQTYVPGGRNGGALEVKCVAFDTRDDDSGFGVMPVKSIWMLSGDELDESDPDAPMASNAERAWAQTVMANALAHKIDDDDEKGRAAYLRELVLSAVRFAKAWGYELTFDTDVTPQPSRSRVPRTMRPSGPGGRSPKQRRKR
jgi:hypothetical protein